MVNVCEALILKSSSSLLSNEKQEKKVVGIKPKCLLIQITRPHQRRLSAAVSVFHSIFSHQGQELWRKSSNRHTTQAEAVSLTSLGFHTSLSELLTRIKSPSEYDLVTQCWFITLHSMESGALVNRSLKNLESLHPDLLIFDIVTQETVTWPLGWKNSREHA